MSNPVQKLVTFFVSFSAVAHMYIRTNGENLGNKSMQCDCCCKCFRLQNQGHKKCLWRSFPACNNRCSTRRSLPRIKGGGKSFAILPSKSLGDSFPQSLDTYLPSTFFSRESASSRIFLFCPDEERISSAAPFLLFSSRKFFWQFRKQFPFSFRLSPIREKSPKTLGKKSWHFGESRDYPGCIPSRRMRRRGGGGVGGKIQWGMNPLLSTCSWSCWLFLLLPSFLFSFFSKSS